MYGGHRRSGSGDLMISVCHVALEDHVIKALNEFMIRSPSRIVTIVPSLMATGIEVVEVQ